MSSLVVSGFRSFERVVEKGCSKATRKQCVEAMRYAVGLADSPDVNSMQLQRIHQCLQQLSTQKVSVPKDIRTQLEGNTFLQRKLSPQYHALLSFQERSSNIATELSAYTAAIDVAVQKVQQDWAQRGYLPQYLHMLWQQHFQQGPLRIDTQQLHNMIQYLWGDSPVLCQHALSLLEQGKFRELSVAIQEAFQSYSDYYSGKFHIDLTAAKVDLSVTFGGTIQKAAAGANGAKIVYSLEGKPIAVFKSSCRIAWWKIISLITHLIKRYCLGQLSLLRGSPVARVQTEEMSYLLDRLFQFNCTPATKMHMIHNQIGSLMVFLEGYTSAEEKQYFELGSDSAIIKFQLFTLFDFLTGNLDGKLDNWFIKTKGQCLEDIRRIDGGNSFLVYNPSRWHITNQYEWSALPVCKQQFDPQVVRFIRNLQETDLDAFCEEHRDFFNAQMKDRLKERFLILKHCVATGKVHTPQQLAQIRYSQDFQNHLAYVPRQIA